MKIIVGFSKPADMKFKLFAWLIMKGYGTPYSHVYIKLNSSKYDRSMYYQASGRAVNFMGNGYFNQHNLIVQEFEIEMDDKSYVGMMKFAIDTCGAPYGLKACFAMAYIRIGEIFGQRWSSSISDKTHSFVCSELVSYILENYAGTKLPKIPDDMTPKDIYDLVVSVVK